MNEKKKMYDTLQEVKGALIGAGTYGIRKVEAGFNWDHFAQEITEDVIGLLISVVGGFFMMRLLGVLFPKKNTNAAK